MGCHRGSPKPSRASLAPRASAGGRGRRDAAGVPRRGRGGPGRCDHERLSGKRPEGGAQAHDPLLRRREERDRGDEEAGGGAPGVPLLERGIVRPSTLTDEPAEEKYILGIDRIPKGWRIPREDVAEFVLDQLDDDRHLGRAIAMTT